jgi:hypothetical protein
MNWWLAHAPHSKRRLLEAGREIFLPCRHEFETIYYHTTQAQFSLVNSTMLKPLFAWCSSGVTRECECGVSLRCGNKDISATSPEALECWRTFTVKTNYDLKCCVCAELESICLGCKTQHRIWGQVRGDLIKERIEFVNAWILFGCRKPVEFLVAKELAHSSSDKNQDQSKCESFKSDMQFMNDLIGANLENLSKTKSMLAYYKLAKAENRLDILNSKESFLWFFERNQQSKIGSQSDANPHGQSPGPSLSPAHPVQVPSPLPPSGHIYAKHVFSSDS